MFRWPDPERFFQKDIAPGVGELIYVPLDLLTKDPLTGLDGTRPDGSPLPIVPFGRSAALAAAGITSLVWGQSLSRRKRNIKPATAELLDAIVSGPPELASHLLASALRDPHTELAAILPTHDPVRGLLEELATNVMLLVPAPYEPGKEIVYRYTCCRPIEKGVTAPRRDLRSLALWFDRQVAPLLGFADLSVKHPELSLGWSHSYHFEVDAPGEVRIPRGQLFGKYAAEDTTHLIAETGDAPIIALHARRPTLAAFADAEATTPTTPPPILPKLPEPITTAGALQATKDAKPTPTNRSDQGYAKIWFRLDPFGTFLAATVVSVLTALLLLVAITRLPELDGQTSAALLLALPILTLGYLTRPGEHSIATRLLSAIRPMSLTVGICSLIIAGIIAGGFVHHGSATTSGYACHASVTDVEHHPLPHHTWRSTPDPDILHLICQIGKTKPSVTHISPVTQGIADTATAIAMILAVLLSTGWISTQRRGSGRREPDAPNPPSH